MKTLKLTMAALAVTAAPAMAQMMTPAWDGDGDTLLSQDEFNVGFSQAGIFGGYDRDADGMLNEQEYADSFVEIENYRDEGYLPGDFADFDADADGMLSEDEYNTSWFSEYDVDGSGVLEEEERMVIENDLSQEGFFNRERDI
ncbi:hypothetical protein [Jannaschia aquimarina]|uniref:EF hand n=1 Tax=Jannaschia aquimarina TaxID=935700 RepID=A0A0D1DBK6_9RHOB|nr:hypothetical protein [Jannaschia aquimarina]KIT17338.1 EF hand [Jannaschia aquimarina]SNT20540.1 hypothetical protein SAMN05421775_107196 [Jannaschia aquimarina]